MSKAKEIREQLKITQEEAAKRIGISRYWLYQIENGTANPTQKVMVKMSDLYGVPAAEIFFSQTGNKKFQKKGSM